MVTIFAVTELKSGQVRKTGLEVLTQARILADQKGGRVVALCISAGQADAAIQLAAYGADVVLLAEDSRLENYHPDYYSQVVLAAARQTGAQLILFSATNAGKDLAPRLSVALHAVIATDCTAINFAGDDIEVQKPLYAGKILSKMLLTGDVKIVSLRPNVFEAKECRPGAAANAEKMTLPELASRLTLKEVRKTGGNKLDVADADIIVTGGRGMRAAEHFVLIDELAAALGAAIGATRAVVDAGWRPHSEQVGQTGKVVSPNLYILTGASGSIQHWAGMSGSKCIVAINKDANAPIMQRADYSIVGDLFEVVPVLTAEIKKIRE